MEAAEIQLTSVKRRSAGARAEPIVSKSNKISASLRKVTHWYSLHEQKYTNLRSEVTNKRMCGIFSPSFPFFAKFLMKLNERDKLGEVI